MSWKHQHGHFGAVSTWAKYLASQSLSIFINEVGEIIQVRKFALRVPNPLIIEFTQYFGRTEYMLEVAQDENINSEQGCLR